MEDLLNVEETADRLRVSPATIRSWRFYGAIPAVKIGRRVFFRRDLIDKIQVEGLRVDGIRKRIE